MRFRAAQRSLSRSLAYAVAKATGVTGAILIGYVSTAVVADLGNLADGRQVEQQVEQQVQTGPNRLDLGDLPRGR